MKNNNFVPIIKDNKIYYGGNQSWWINRDEGVKAFGCGIIAMCNMELYLQRPDKEAAMPYEAYIAYVDKRREEVYSLLTGKYLMKLGLLPWKMKRGIKKYYKIMGKQVRVLWAPTLRKDKLLQCISHMLEQDIPITASYYAKDKLVFYSYNEKEDDMKKATLFKNHYFNITDIKEWQGENYFKISSWGVAYYIKAEDWLEHRSLFSNILYIEEK